MSDFTTLTRLEFGLNFDSPLRPGELPPNLEYLYLGELNQELPVGSLPPKLKEIVFGNSYNVFILPNVLPSSLKRIKFGSSFNQYLVAGVIPLGCETLCFGHQFDQTIEVNVIPPTVTTLKFGFFYNRRIQQGVLKNVKSLTLGYLFNQTVVFDDQKQSFLSRLVGGESFIPSTLEYLEIDNTLGGMMVNRPPAKTLKSLISLSVNFHYTEQYSHYLVRFIDNDNSLVIRRSTMEGGIIPKSKLFNSFAMKNLSIMREIHVFSTNINFD
ncbi:hypothetical protein PPL_12010 [Heterostelium album PN500]|uniref:FNIP repeat-containing protein n=1 Tax=Heterostelium pallidum (strain ATCC 26659 / Pp 5 / PN500) TaxID=670386 RepID=D3BV38_HETP5|nr:hypothetical protein PPL_12010 [Heterostelium album PN500]EFA74976.1 hypothetical protein PPL_12010 [Heterostelium album PN500]|eukprot:XP_020427110.1 hypothetical protein PPL_12010 [Heterostelium album PN500]